MALRSEVRRLAGEQLRGTLKPLRQLGRQMNALRLEARAQRQTLVRLERRLARARGGLGPAPLGAGGRRRGRPLSSDSIRRLRDRLRMTRQQFARVLGVSAGSIFGWESGRTQPRQRSLSRFEALRKMGLRKARAKFQAARPARRGPGKPRRPRARRARNARRRRA